MRDLASKSEYLILHLPIEYSIVNILLRRVSRSHRVFGHINFFSWGSARIFIERSPFTIIGYQFTSASDIYIKKKNNIFKKMLLLLRYYCYKIMPCIGPTLFGGSVLLLLKNKAADVCIPTGS